MTVAPAPRHYPVEGIFYEGSAVRVENLAHGVKRLVLSRADVRNAFNETMIGEISEALTRLGAVPSEADFRLLVLQGEGHTFCAGADLAYMRKQAEGGLPASLRDARLLGQMYLKLASCPVPVVAAVRGAAVGGGFGLVVCSDSVLAEEHAVFATTEVRLGLVPGVISPYIVRKLGVGFAQRFMLTGARVKAGEAFACGLVARVAPPGQSFDEALDEAITGLLQAGPNAARRTKLLLKKASPLPSPEVFEFAALQIAEARCSPEGAEGLRAFFEKTPPAWVEGLPKERT